MQLNNLVKPVIGIMLAATFTFASSTILAQGAGQTAGQTASQAAGKPVRKHKTADELCKAKYPDTKSGNYRGCIRYAKRMAEKAASGKKK